MADEPKGKKNAKARASAAAEAVASGPVDMIALRRFPAANVLRPDEIEACCGGKAYFAEGDAFEPPRGCSPEAEPEPFAMLDAFAAPNEKAARSLEAPGTRPGVDEKGKSADEAIPPFAKRA